MPAGRGPVAVLDGGPHGLDHQADRLGPVVQPGLPAAVGPVGDLADPHDDRGGGVDAHEAARAYRWRRPGAIPARYTRAMRIAVGSDHAGFDLKTALAKHVAGAGHQVVDLGTDSPDVSVDYPVFGLAVGRAVAEGRADRGICVCGTGIGISIAANKVDGIRAALVHDVDHRRPGPPPQRRQRDLPRREDHRGGRGHRRRRHLLLHRLRGWPARHRLAEIAEYESTESRSTARSDSGATGERSTDTTDRKAGAETMSSPLPPRPSTAGWPTTPR